MIYVEIELDGVTCAKRCPNFRTDDGRPDFDAIREYFGSMGYSVGDVRLV